MPLPYAHPTDPSVSVLFYSKDEGERKVKDFLSSPEMQTLVLRPQTSDRTGKMALEGEGAAKG